MGESMDKYGDLLRRKKIVFFVKQGLDSFLGEIIDSLSRKYETKKIIVNNYEQIDEGMAWGDICWFEWCDELIIYGSSRELASQKKIICRLHSYEAFTNYPSSVNFETVDKFVFIGEHIRDFVVKNFNLNMDKTVVIPNGISLDKYKFKERTLGYNIAYVGYINYKKGPMLLLHTFKAMYDKDQRYRLFIAGEFQDVKDVLYFNKMISEFGIQNNVIYQGWQSDLDNWLEDKNYILSTSILESQNMSIMQAMAKGIKPIIHNFVGAKEIYKREYVWNTIEEAIRMLSDTYSSIEYRNFIDELYNINTTSDKLGKEILLLI